MPNNKLNYKQYKHLIDVFTTGDFLTESLDKPVGLITYRRLLTEDNILYFTQNTKRTCRVPLGISKRDGNIKQINLMDNGFTYRYGSKTVLDNLARLTICCLLQNYNPNEYEVYYDLEIRDLNSLDNFHFISSTNMLNNVYSNLARERHKRYAETGDYSYKEYRKSHDDKLIIFILTNNENINVMRSISGAHNRYGIAILNLEQHEIANSSSISLANTIRPNIDDYEMDNEIKNYKKMLGEFNKMNNEINLLTGEIINEGDLHEELVIKLPLPYKAQKFKEDLEKSNLSEEERKPHEILLEEIENHEYSIYNMRQYGYQFGGENANGDYGSFYHHLLREARYLNVPAIRYIITASVFTLFSHSSIKLRDALLSQGDLSDRDKEKLRSYIERQTNYYSRGVSSGFSLNLFDQYCEIRNFINYTFFETFCCKVELKEKRLFISINGKEKQLEDYLLFFVDAYNKTINNNILELILRYELYLEFGIQIPRGVRYSFFYTENKYILAHQPLDYSLEELQERLEKIGALDKNYDKLSYSDFCELVSSAYEDLDEDKIKSYINYWLWRKDDLRKILPKGNDTVQNMNLF